MSSQCGICTGVVTEFFTAIKPNSSVETASPAISTLRIDPKLSQVPVNCVLLDVVVHTTLTSTSCPDANKCTTLIFFSMTYPRLAVTNLIWFGLS